MAKKIKITDYVYSCAIVCLAEMQDGDTWTWEAENVERSYGCYMLTGSLTMSRSSDPDFIPYECGVTGQFTKGDVLDDTQVANAYTSWICLTKIEGRDRIITLQKVDTTFDLPTGTGFIVLEGIVEVNGITANQCQYFRPRDANLTITGPATIALVA